MQISFYFNYSNTQPPSPCAPAGVEVCAAVAQISSKAIFKSSPVTAEHSTYLSALTSCDTLYPSWGIITPFGSDSDLRSLFRPTTMTGM